jgi:hypothetical protein
MKSSARLSVVTLGGVVLIAALAIIGRAFVAPSPSKAGHQAGATAAPMLSQGTHQDPSVARKPEIPIPDPPAPTPVRTLKEALTEVMAKFGQELGRWESISAKEGLVDLYFRIRPKVVRDDQGRIVEYTFANWEALFDGSYEELAAGGPKPGPKRTLQQIDLVIEQILSRNPLVAEHDLVEFLRQARSGTSGLDENFLKAASVRVLLGLRELKSNQAGTLTMLEEILSAEKDPLARSASAAVLACTEKQSTVVRWLQTENDSKAISGALAAWDRFIVNPIRVDGKTYIEDAPVDPESGILITQVMSDQARSSDLRSEAVRALRSYVGNPVILGKLSELIRSDPDPGVREAAILGLDNAVSNRAVADLLVDLAFSPTVTDREQRAATACMRAIGTGIVTEALASKVLDPSAKNRGEAARALVGRTPRPDDATIARLKGQHGREVDPEVKKAIGLVLGITNE